MFNYFYEEIVAKTRHVILNINYCKCYFSHNKSIIFICYFTSEEFSLILQIYSLTLLFWEPVLNVRTKTKLQFVFCEQQQQKIKKDKQVYILCFLTFFR